MRWSRRRTPEDLLARYWDALVMGAPPQELERRAALLDPSVVDLVNQTRAAHRSRLPDPTFVDRLERHAMDAFTQTLGSPIPLRPAQIVPTPRRLPAPAAAAPLDALRRRARPILAGFGAVAIALAIGLLLVFTFVPGRDIGPPPMGDVPVFRGGPARTGVLPGPGPRQQPVLRWTLATGGRLAGTPSVADGVVYVGDAAGILHAVDAATGTERWQAAMAGAIGAAPAVADGIVYAGDQAGNLAAFDAATGSQRWSVSLGAGSAAALYASAPVVVDGTLYVASGGGASTPAVEDGVVFVGGTANVSLPPTSLHAFDAATGAARWRFPADAGSGLTTPGIYAVDAASGTKRWSYATVGDVRGAPAVVGGVVYAAASDGAVAALDAATGTERWRIAAGEAIVSSPAVAGGTVFVGGAAGWLYALDAATGKESWRAQVGAVRNSAPTVADAVYVVAGGQLVALDADGGRERWRVPVGPSVDTSPVVDGGLVILGGADASGTGTVLALGDPQ